MANMSRRLLFACTAGLALAHSLVAAADGNHAPVATDITYTRAEDYIVIFGLQGTDPDGDRLRFALTRPPAHGTLSGPVGVMQYTPARNFHGVDSFEFQVSDGRLTDTGIVTIIYTPVDDPPTALDDVVVLGSEAWVDADVTANDTEPDGDGFAVEAVTAPRHGTAEVLDGHQIRYRPSPGFVGSDELSYTVKDEHGLAATAMVHIGVGQFASGAPAEAIAAYQRDRIDETGAPALSGDGRLVAFVSDASGLVGADRNGASDVFVYDRVLGTFERVSVSSNGVEGNAASFAPAISADGRFVAFVSRADNLVGDDRNGKDDVFLRDRAAGTTVRVSVGGVGEADGDSSAPRISANGAVVAFLSRASNLVAGDDNGAADVFVRDVAAGATVRASVGASGEEAEREATDVALSGDGRVVAFTSEAANLVPGDQNGFADIFVRDLAAGTIERASVSRAGVEASGASRMPSLSFDGGVVAFLSDARNLDGGPSGRDQVRAWVRDRRGYTSIAGQWQNINRVAMAADGRHLLIGLEDGAVISKDWYASDYRWLSRSNTADLLLASLSPDSRYVVTISPAALERENATTGPHIFVLPNPL